MTFWFIGQPSATEPLQLGKCETINILFPLVMVASIWALNLDCNNQMLSTKKLNLKELDKDAGIIRDYLLQGQWHRDGIKHPAIVLLAVLTSHRHSPVVVT